MPSENETSDVRQIRTEERVHSIQQGVSEIHTKVDRMVEDISLIMQDRLVLDHAIKYWQEQRGELHEKNALLEQKVDAHSNTLSEYRGSLRAFKWVFSITSSLLVAAILGLVTMLLSAHDQDTTQNVILLNTREEIAALKTQIAALTKYPEDIRR